MLSAGGSTGHAAAFDRIVRARIAGRRCMPSRHQTVDKLFVVRSQLQRQRVHVADSVRFRAWPTVSPLRADPTGSVLPIEAHETLESDTTPQTPEGCKLPPQPRQVHASHPGRVMPAGEWVRLANRGPGSFTAVPGACEPRAAVRAALTGTPARLHQTALKSGAPSARNGGENASQDPVGAQPNRHDRARCPVRSWCSSSPSACVSTLRHP